MKAFSGVLNGWVGVSSEPIALVATKVVKGVNYVFLCKCTTAYPNAEPTIKLVIVNNLLKTADFETLLYGGDSKNMTLGMPLGEWP